MKIRWKHQGHECRQEKGQLNDWAPRYHKIGQKEESCERHWGEAVSQEETYTKICDILKANWKKNVLRRKKLSAMLMRT